jgi:hypothetical protein
MVPIDRAKGTVIPLQAEKTLRVTKGRVFHISRQSAHCGDMAFSPTHSRFNTTANIRGTHLRQEAELIPGPWCGRKDYVHEKF